MDDLEKTVGQRLATRAAQASLPPGLDHRVTAGVRRRRQRRRGAAAASAAVAVGAAIAVPALVISGQEEDPAARPTTTAPVPGLRIPMSEKITLSRRLPKGLLLRALGVGDDGTIVGTGATAGTDATDERLWRWQRGGSRPSASEDRQIWTVKSGGGLILWPKPSGDTGTHDQLMCETRGGPPRQLGGRGVSEQGGDFYVDRGVVVWSDDGTEGTRSVPHQVWTAKDCTGTPRSIDHGGRLVAFSYPYAYVLAEVHSSGKPTGLLRQIHVGTGQIINRQVPISGKDALEIYAAGPSALVRADQRTMTIFDTRSWKAKKLPIGLPSDTEQGYSVSMTVGKSVITYSLQPQDGDPEGAPSMVYDLRNEHRFVINGDAYAHGEWLLWSEGDRFHLGRVRTK